MQNEIPRPKPRVGYTEVTEAYVVVRKGDAYLVRQRTAGERWAGLWDFPRCELAAEEAAECHYSVSARNGQKALPLGETVPAGLCQRLEREVVNHTGVRVQLGMPFAELRHGVTRFRIRVICFEARSRTRSASDREGVRWATTEDLQELPLSRTGRRLTEILVNNS